MDWVFDGGFDSGTEGFILFAEVNGLSMLCGYAIPNPNHFVKSRFVDEISAANTDVLECFESAAAAAKL